MVPSDKGLRGDSNSQAWTSDTRAGLARPKTLLLVEDSPAEAELFKEALQPIQNVELIWMSDGRRALAELDYRAHQGDQALPDLVVLDLIMPGLRGDALLQEMRANPRLRELPVIVLSSTDDIEEVKHLYAIGANCYLMKPASPRKYFSLVRAAVEFWLSVAVLSRERATFP